MTDTKKQTQKEETKTSYDDHEDDLEVTKQPPGNTLWWPVDFAIYRLWLRGINEEAKKVKDGDLRESVKHLRSYVNRRGILRQYLIRMLEQAVNVYGEVFKAKILPSKANDFWKMVNCIIQKAPAFHGLNLGGDPSLIGVPLAAFFTLYDGTPSGVKLFGDNEFNKQLQKLLNDWGNYLNSSDSTYVLNDKPRGWLSKRAKKQWQFDDYILPSPEAPYWSSWNDFFHREIKKDLRPIGDGITSCNDGYVWVYPYRDNIKKEDKFWLKDSMPYSMNQIFGPDLHEYVKHFIGGSIFQTFLGPFNYHRWHAPVSGKIKKVHVTNGCFYKKLIVPDLSGSTTSSLPYILHVNTRGFVIIDTSETLKIGLVCCIPIGMVEVSSIIYSVKEGQKIKKGEELGMFAFGGSSFAIVFENLKKYKKKIEIVPPFNKKASLPTPTGGGTPIKFGQQFAKLCDIKV